MPLAELIARIPLDGRRPLASDRAQLERLYAARTESYRMAHLRANASRSSASAVVDQIIDALNAFPRNFGAAFQGE